MWLPCPFLLLLCPFLFFARLFLFSVLFFSLFSLSSLGLVFAWRSGLEVYVSFVGGKREGGWGGHLFR